MTVHLELGNKIILGVFLTPTHFKSYSQQDWRGILFLESGLFFTMDSEYWSNTDVEDGLHIVDTEASHGGPAP